MAVTGHTLGSCNPRRVMIPMAAGHWRECVSPFSLCVCVCVVAEPFTFMSVRGFLTSWMRIQSSSWGPLAHHSLVLWCHTNTHTHRERECVCVCGLVRANESGHGIMRVDSSASIDNRQLSIRRGSVGLPSPTPHSGIRNFFRKIQFRTPHCLSLSLSVCLLHPPHCAFCSHSCPPPHLLRIPDNGASLAHTLLSVWSCCAACAKDLVHVD